MIPDQATPDARDATNPSGTSELLQIDRAPSRGQDLEADIICVTNFMPKSTILMVAWTMEITFTKYFHTEH